MKAGFKRLAGCGIKSMRPIFKTEMLIYQSNTNSDEKILSGKITHHLDPEFSKMLDNGKFGSEGSTFHSSPWFIFYRN